MGDSIVVRAYETVDRHGYGLVPESALALWLLVSTCLCSCDLENNPWVILAAFRPRVVRVWVVSIHFQPGTVYANSGRLHGNRNRELANTHLSTRRSEASALLTLALCVLCALWVRLVCA